jgi:aarF domain-containing kinase
VFTDKYMQLLYSASIQDKEACLHWSKELGFLTGYETNSMNEAHINSLFLLAYPFSTKSGSSFSFGDQQITEKVRSAIPTMLRERLTPPPDESYSLHRKLSGCFLLCTKLKAKINSSQIFQECYSNYK